MVTLSKCCKILWDCVMCATSFSIFVFFQGTAFVKFASAESAEKCMAASETDGIFLDGRQVRKLAYCLNLTKLILINSINIQKWNRDIVETLIQIVSSLSLLCMFPSLTWLPMYCIHISLFQLLKQSKKFRWTIFFCAFFRFTLTWPWRRKTLSKRRRRRKRKNQKIRETSSSPERAS